MKNKKIVSLISKFLLVALVFCGGVFPGEAYSKTSPSLYKDLGANHWARDYIEDLSKKGLIDGYSDKTFRPEANIKTGEFVKLIITSQGMRPLNGKEKSHWASGYYEKALKLGYLCECRISLEDLDQDITRRDMAYLISKILPQNIYTYPGEEEKPLADKALLEEKAKDIHPNDPDEFSISRALTAGVLTGYPDNTFKGEKGLTRAESATVIYRLQEAKKEALIRVPEFGQGLYTKETGHILEAMENYISNREDYEYLLKDVKYAFYTDRDPYMYDKGYSLLDAEYLLSFPHYGGRQMLFIKDKKAIRTAVYGDGLYFIIGSPNGFRLDDYDYLAYFNYGQDTMMIVSYPF